MIHGDNVLIYGGSMVEALILHVGNELHGQCCMSLIFRSIIVTQHVAGKHRLSIANSKTMEIR